jgi:GTP-binding protein HflX
MEGEGRLPIIEALNKADKLDPDVHEAAVERAERDPDVILVSALTGEGIPQLKALLAERLQGPGELHTLMLHPSDGRRLAWLHANGEVINQADRGGQIEVQVRLEPDAERRFRAL